jgi:hypothetical protein
VTVARISAGVVARVLRKFLDIPCVSFVVFFLGLWLEFLGGSPLCFLESCFATLDLSTGESGLEVELPMFVDV